MNFRTGVPSAARRDRNREPEQTELRARVFDPQAFRCILTRPRVFPLREGWTREQHHIANHLDQRKSLMNDKTLPWCQSRFKKGPGPGGIVGHWFGLARALARVPITWLTRDKAHWPKASPSPHPSLIDQALSLRLCRSRKLSPFISRIWTWWVRRSRMAPVRRSDPKTSVHSSKGRFEVMMIEPRS